MSISTSEGVMFDPYTFWNNLSDREDYREYILPKRSDIEFEAEGIQQAAALNHLIQPTSIILDYGCGIGRVTRYLAPYCQQIVGIDICDKFIEIAKERNQDIPNIYFGTIDEYATISNKFDLVFAIMVLQHNEPPIRLDIIKHIHQLLKPNGIAYINFPKESSSRYTETEFTKVFSKIDVENYGKLFSSYNIYEGNLPLLKDANMLEKHEYFLEAIK